MMKYELYSPTAAICGILSMVTLDEIISTYLMLITIICGTISIVRTLIHVFKIIHDFVTRKKTASETIKNLDELEEEIKNDLK